MDKSHWVRMFKIPYRKDGRRLIREANVQCETIKSGLYTAGSKTFVNTDTRVTAHLVVPFFEQPRTEEEQIAVDKLYEQLEQTADEYVRSNYPDAVVTSVSPQ